MNEKILSRDFVFAWLSAFFDASVFYLLVTTMALYTTERFNASASISGLTSSIYIIGALVGRLFTGRFMDVVGRRRLILCSFLIYFISTVGYLFAGNMGILLGIRCVHGITFGISSTGVMTVAMTILPDSRKGEGAGYFGIAPTLSTAIGPFLGTFLLSRYSYRMVFVACIVCAALCLLFTCLIRIRPVQLSPEERRERTTHLLNPKNYFEAKAMPVAFCLLLVAVCYSSVLSFVTSFAWSIGLGAASSLFFLVYAAFLVFGRPVSGRLLDRRGSNVAMFPTLSCMVIGLLLLASTRSWPTLLISAAFFAMGYGATLSTTQAIAVKRSPITHYAMAVSTVYVCADVGSGLGPVFMGALIEHGGYRFVYHLCAVVAAAVIVLYYFLHGRHPLKGSLRK